MAPSFLLPLTKKKLFVITLLLLIIYLLQSFIISSAHFGQREIPPYPRWALQNEHDRKKQNSAKNEEFSWKTLAERYPVHAFILFPEAETEITIPKIQAAEFPVRNEAAKRIQKERLAVVKGNFTHAWNGYRRHAWLKDEVRPISKHYANPFGGWGASLVDALGTLWIMGMHDEFETAVQVVKSIDFSTSSDLDHINLFETTIRYLGGLLSAYDLSEGKYPILLNKAIELGDMLYHAFDTPNRMPVTRWHFKNAISQPEQWASKFTLVAELGSLTLEFTRLSQLTGDIRYYDAVQRITNLLEEHQKQTHLPGLWPVEVNARDERFNESNLFTLGGMSDSLYEYLPKQFLLLGGASPQYQSLYEEAIEPMRQHIFYRPMTPEPYDVLLAGEVESNGTLLPEKLETIPQAQHLSCFAGGMVGLGAKIFEIDGDLDIARKLVEGCLWAYETGPQGIMPEIMFTVPCADKRKCPWDEAKWQAEVLKAHELEHGAQYVIQGDNLSPGVTKIPDRRYLLRPEAIESIWYLYRITGDPSYQERAWKIFETIVAACTTEIAHAALNDCTTPELPKDDKMESFWLAETLRYFYLLFADEELISLDEWVLNTEAHPLKRPSSTVLDNPGLVYGKT